ncbi:MAG: PAS domain S-box protein [Anaerolineae bacterium]|nr:PAS domain S-box protein [Anaerolineae bacterium]
MKMKSKVKRSESSGRALNGLTGPYQQDDLKRIQGRYSPASILLITVTGIAVAEVIAMIVVYSFRHMPYYQQVAIDATVMTVIVFPILYFLSFRPILQHVSQRYQVERVLKSRLRIVQYANTHTLAELLQFTLDELESLTGSMAGYFHFVGADQKTIELQAWSTNTIQNICKVEGLISHYSLEKAGVWADCVRQRKVVIHNDYASLPDRKGLPDGHARIVREMAVPIMRDEKIMSVLGMGNKPKNYTSRDVEVVSTLADFTWDIIKQKQAADAQRESDEKFRTLANWTYDWELSLDPDGRIIYTSPSCERITGYGTEEFMADPNLLIRITHPDERDFYEKHHELVHDMLAGVEKVEYRIVSLSGEEHWVEHICRPVFGEDERYLGRRVSNRDITQRKQAERELVEQNRKERILTETIHTMQLDIARDLHDTIGQNIGFLRMKLEYLSGKSRIKKTELLNELQTMTDAANESYDLIRGTLAVLQSGDSSDLFLIFSRYAEQIVERSGIEVNFSTDGTPKVMAPKRMRQLFYIFREALTNIEKHAQASRVSIVIGWGDGCLNLTITDDGKGFNPFEVPYGSHYGLKFMKERAGLLNGSLNVHSAVGSGTRLVIEVPYE